MGRIPKKENRMKTYHTINSVKLFDGSLSIAIDGLLGRKHKPYFQKRRITSKKTINHNL